MTRDPLTGADPRAELELSLQRRIPTWRAAELILALGLGLDKPLRRDLRGLIPAEWRRHGWLNDDFDRPISAERQVETFLALFPEISVAGRVADDPMILRRLVDLGARSLDLPAELTTRLLALHLLPTLEVSAAQAEFGPGRILGLAATDRIHLARSVRKRLRFLRRLEERANQLESSISLRRAQMQAKSRLAYAINPSGLDDLTLAYCAYFAARANRRTQFMLGPQSRATDTITERLHALLVDNESTDWAQVALLHPVPADIMRCDVETRGRLVGVFHQAMLDASLGLMRLYHTLPQRMRAEMVMVKEVDSSSWNAYAGAFNTMRAAWIAACTASGLEHIFDSYLPGKAPRLMASDLAWWYRSQGKDLHEDTALFAMLPKPWDVALGEAQLDRLTIAGKASDAGIDVSTGWTGPRGSQHAIVEQPETDPMLVHGIVVADLVLARTLKRCRVFSGKATRYLDDLPDEIVRAEIHDGERVSQPVLGSTQAQASNFERE